MKFKVRHFVIFGVLLFLIISSSFYFFSSSPSSHNKQKEINIEKGLSLKQIAQNLKDSQIIRSRSIFLITASFLNYEKEIISGEYRFEKPVSVFEVLERLHKGEYGIPTLSVVLYEGMSVYEMSEQLLKIFPNFDSKSFKEKAIEFEGYLFPDTYFFRENISVDEVIKKLRENFEKRTKEIGLDKFSKEELEKIIIMASIIEKESTADGRQEVSNILWKRLDMGMPLQVDATFMYERGQGTFDLTLEDLKNDSQFNTYTRKGLPPTPIGNPGIESIKTAMNPKETKNLYFLTGKDGEMYYAKNFEEHKRNKELYLK